MTRRVLAAVSIAALTACGSVAYAQPAAEIWVPSCGTSGAFVGIGGCQLPTTGSFSASIQPFQAGEVWATLTPGASSTRAALPTGTTIVVYNTGANAVSVALGASSVVATTTEDTIQPNSWMSFYPNGATYLAAISANGTANAANSLIVSGGSGIPTGAGGGGGGTGGGAISIASGQVASGAYVDGAVATLGTTTDAAYGGSGAASAITLLKGLYAAVTSTAIPQGSNIIGKVSAVDSGGSDATDTSNHAFKVNCVVGCSGSSGFAITSTNYLTSGAVNFTSTTAAVAIAGVASNYIYVTDLDCTNYSLYPASIAVLNSASAVLYSVMVTPGGGWAKNFGAAYIGGGAGQMSVGTAISLQAGGPAYAGANTGTATISSGTYVSASGLVTLTLSANAPFPAPETLVISGLTGTGAFASLDGTFTATSISATTVTYQGPTGLGATTITGGSAAYSPSVTCNLQGFKATS